MVGWGECPNCPGPRVPHRCGKFSSPECPRCPGPNVPHNCGKTATAYPKSEPAFGRGRGGGKGSARGQNKGRGGQGGIGSVKATATVPKRTSHEVVKPVVAKPHPLEKPTHQAQRTQTVFNILRSELDKGFSLRGCILGEGGANLRRIWEETHARVVFKSSDDNPQDGTEVDGAGVAAQLCILGGRGADLSAAAARVRQLLEMVRAKQSQVVELEFDVDPAFPLRPCILGARGENLQRIRDRTGVRVMLEDSCGASSSSSCTSIPSLRIIPSRTVDASGMGSAKEMIRELLMSVRKSQDSWKESGKISLSDSSPPLPPPAAPPRSRDSRRVQRGLQGGDQNVSAAKTMVRPRAAVDRVGDFCSLFPMGACPFSACDCPRGTHGEPAASTEDKVLLRITQAKKRLLQQKWTDAGGAGELVDVWQIHNPRLEFLFRASECDFAETLGHGSDLIDGWHGTAEENVLSIAVNGFDPDRRSGQVYGAGEYFAKDPAVSMGYARGGALMFLCKLLLGQADLDHTWVDSCSYYVVKQRDRRVQALPLFLVQFKESCGDLSQRLSDLVTRDVEAKGHLATLQRGGFRACEARRDAGMEAEATRHLWVGWLAPELCQQNNDAVAEDVERFLHGYAVAEVIPERNGARIGAFVLLTNPIGKADYNILRRRRYRGEGFISVDDQQPNNPRCRGKVCPRLTGPSHFCRGWNLRGHQAWQWGCPFDHPATHSPTYGAKYTLVPIKRGTAKFDEIETDLVRSAPFVSADGPKQPKIVAVSRVVNKALESLYEERRAFLVDKHGYAMEKELWHGTSCKALPELLTHGLQPPSDTAAAPSCPRSGGKGLCTTLCGSDCKFCRDEHCWDRCHMYGLGVYMADQAQKSHRYVREPSVEAIPARTAVWQTVLLGKWCDFDISQQEEFEDAMKSGQDVYKFSARGWPYNLDFRRMVQINLSTGRERSVRRIEVEDDGESRQGRKVYSMLRCRVCLGSPYLIEGNLMKTDAMHDMCWCQNPSDALESTAETWSISKGHDAFYIRGLAGTHKAGLGVYNSEYVIFQPFQILPMYQVDYVLE